VAVSSREVLQAAAMTDYTVPRDSRRVPLATRVQLKFEWFSGFISEYSANISPGGMFIRTQTPELVGRVLGFEFRLGDGFELIQGTGEVAWVRQLDESVEKPAGMGLRFLELSPHSRELIGRMVENYIREGGTPFDVANAPAATVPPAQPPAALPAAAPAPPPAADPAPAVATPLEDASPQSPATPAAPPVPPLPANVLAVPIEPPPPPHAERSSWPGLLATSAAPVAQPGEPDPGVPERVSRERPVRVSRLVLWMFFAAFLGGAAWVVLSQDLLLGWLTRRGTAAVALPAPPRRAARLHHAAAGPANAAPASAAEAVEAAAPARPAASVASTPEPRVAVAPASPSPPSASPTPPAPVAAASTAPAPLAVDPAGMAALTEIQKITWQQGPDGTEVVLWGNGAFRRQDFVHYRVEGDPPRVLIKLRGILHPFAEGRLIVGTRQVRQVRTGFHDERAGNELHIVLDLAGFGVEVTGMREDADKLHIFVKGS
jgi:molecular chaperone DnaK